MNLDNHDYIIITIILAIIILQVIVFIGNLKKIDNYKKTIRQAKNFEIVEVAVPEDWIREIEVKEILSDPDAFRKLSANYSKQDENHIEPFENEEKEPYLQEDQQEKDISNAPPTEEDSPEELNFPEEELYQENEVEEYEEDDFIFEEQEDTKSK